MMPREPPRSEAQADPEMDVMGNAEQLLSQDEIEQLSSQAELWLTGNEIAALRPQVQKFCGDCHASPEPESFPADAWRDEVHNGFNFYLESGRTGLSPPPLEDVVQYFMQQAPEALALPEPKPAEDSLPLQWAGCQVPSDDNQKPGLISSLEKFRHEEQWKVVATDMVSGAVSIVSFAEGHPRLGLIGSFDHPAKATPCNLDLDGHLDFRVAELGSVAPADHDLGKVIWMKGSATGHYEEHVLLTGVGRVADVQSGDFNGDGRNDVLVAEFGWRK